MYKKFFYFLIIGLSCLSLKSIGATEGLSEEALETAIVNLVNEKTSLPSSLEDKFKKLYWDKVSVKKLNQIFMIKKLPGLCRGLRGSDDQKVSILASINDHITTMIDTLAHTVYCITHLPGVSDEDFNAAAERFERHIPTLTRITKEFVTAAKALGVSSNVEGVGPTSEYSGTYCFGKGASNFMPIRDLVGGHIGEYNLHLTWVLRNGLYLPIVHKYNTSERWCDYLVQGYAIAENGDLSIRRPQDPRKRIGFCFKALPIAERFPPGRPLPITIYEDPGYFVGVLYHIEDSEEDHILLSGDEIGGIGDLTIKQSFVEVSDLRAATEGETSAPLTALTLKEKIISKVLSKIPDFSGPGEFFHFSDYFFIPIPQDEILLSLFSDPIKFIEFADYVREALDSEDPEEQTQALNFVRLIEDADEGEEVSIEGAKALMDQITPEGLSERLLETAAEPESKETTAVAAVRDLVVSTEHLSVDGASIAERRAEKARRRAERSAAGGGGVGAAAGAGAGADAGSGPVVRTVEPTVEERLGKVKTWKNALSFLNGLGFKRKSQKGSHVAFESADGTTLHVAAPHADKAETHFASRFAQKIRTMLTGRK